MKSPKVTKSLIEQVVDLSEVAAGVDFSQSKSLKLAIGESLAEIIRERASSGKGVDGGNVVKLKSPYSKTYAESLEFLAAGKSKGDVNMTLTGDMLASIQVQDRGGNKIALYIDGEENTLKAFNHQTGDTVPKRPFFGLVEKDLRTVAVDFSSEIDSIISREGTRTSDQRARGVLGRALDRLSNTGPRQTLSEALAALVEDDG